MNSQQQQPHWDSDPSRTNQQQFQTMAADPDIEYNIEVQDTPGDKTNEPLHTKRQLRGAAAAGGLAGLVLFGPVVGVAAAGGAALASTAKGGAGKMARASGDAMADVGVRLKRMDRKHRVVEKTSNTVVKGCQWVSKRLKPKDATPAPTHAF